MPLGSRGSLIGDVKQGNQEWIGALPFPVQCRPCVGTFRFNSGSSKTLGEFRKAG